MNKSSLIIAFAAGVATGSLAMWKVWRERYKSLEERMDEEIQYYKDKYSYAKSEGLSEPCDAHPVSTIDLYRDVLRSAGYSNDDESITNLPYVITPEEAGEDDYAISSCTLYKDGVMTDENGKVMDAEEINDLVGLKSLERLGEYEPDAVHVRNEENKIDFEILRVEVNYADVYPKKSSEVDSD